MVHLPQLSSQLAPSGAADRSLSHAQGLTTNMGAQHNIVATSAQARIPATQKEVHQDMQLGPEVLKMPLEKYAAILALTAPGATFGALDSSAVSLLTMQEIKEVRRIR